MDDMRNRYTTISYCAGDPKNTEIVFVNGLEFNAFANLGHALRQARHFWSEKFDTEELLLWVDQVSISQGNSLEQSHQVGFMGDIYENAKQVLISLSSEGDPAGGLEWLRRLTVDYETALGITSDDVPSLFEMSIPTSESKIACNVGALIEDGLDDEEFHLGCDVFFRYITGSLWWSRAWVQQEYYLSREAYFMSAFESLRWKALDNFNLIRDLVPYRLKQEQPLYHRDREHADSSVSSCQACALIHEK